MAKSNGSTRTSSASNPTAVGGGKNVTAQMRVVNDNPTISVNPNTTQRASRDANDFYYNSQSVNDILKSVEKTDSLPTLLKAAQDIVKVYESRPGVQQHGYAQTALYNIQERARNVYSDHVDEMRDRRVLKSKVKDYMRQNYDYLDKLDTLINKFSK